MGADHRWSVAYGHFTKTGTRTGEDARAFVRGGFKFGFALSSRIEQFPLDLVVTDTPMFVIDGAARNISIQETTLSLYLGKARRFGVDLKRTKGRATDLDKRTDDWSVGLAFRY